MSSPRLLEHLAEAARSYHDYLSEPAHMRVHPRYGSVRRDAGHPPKVAMAPDEILRAVQAGWYLSEAELDKRSPKAFVALDGKHIIKGPDGYVNPYGPTGLTGPGILGCSFTASREPTPESVAVDIVVQFIDPTDGRLKFIGGTRMDTLQPCLVGGFQEDDALATAAREFIEEAISGSVLLEPLAPELLRLSVAKQRGQPFTSEEDFYLRSFGIDPNTFSGDRGELVYHFIQKEDPGFIVTIKSFFRDCLEVAYRGPCRADPRTTDQRWVSTTLLTGLIDATSLEHMLKNQKYPYRFSAGSDLAEITHHAFAPAFVKNAFGSHGALICLATAHNLAKLASISPMIVEQCVAVIDAIENYIKPEPALGAQTPPAPLRGIAAPPCVR